MSPEGFEKADLNKNGFLDEREYEIYLEKMRLETADADLMRNAQRRMAYLSLSGMLGFPFGVVATEYLDLGRASDLLAQMSNIYYVSIAGILAAYYGFTNVGGKKQ